MQQSTFRGLVSVLALSVTALLAPGCAPTAGEEPQFESSSEEAVSHCPINRAPVCGTNHHTYQNECRAGSHRIAYSGECNSACNSLVCAAGETCDPGVTCRSGDRSCTRVAAHCVDPTPVDPCATTRCRQGYICQNIDGAAHCITACATVRCSAGHSCQIVGGAASCVPDACPPNTLLCVRGSHYDNTPGVCACVPDACPPNTRLCIRGTHYDGTPGVCACVPDATTCATDADCHLEDNYCGGCACNAYLTGHTGPTCTNPVMCFREPCQGMTARCVAGACTAQ